MGEVVRLPVETILDAAPPVDRGPGQLLHFPIEHQSVPASWPHRVKIDPVEVMRFPEVPVYLGDGLRLTPEDDRGVEHRRYRTSILWGEVYLEESEFPLPVSLELKGRSLLQRLLGQQPDHRGLIDGLLWPRQFTD